MSLCHCVTVSPCHCQAGPTGGPAVREGSQDGVLDEEESRHVVLLEHELAQLLPAVLLVPGRLGEEDRVDLGLRLDDLLVGVIQHLEHGMNTREEAGAPALMR